MTIRIDRRLYGAIKRYPGSIIIAVDTSDPEQATAALRRARSALLNLGQERSDVSLRFVGQVVPGPSGPMLWLDGGGAPSDLLALIPDILRDYLAGAGVDDATLTTAASESLEAYRPIGMASPCLTLRLFPDPPATGVSAYSTVPADWIAAAIDWLNQETQSARHVTVRTAVPFAVETSAVSALLSDAHRAKVGEISIMTGQTSTRLSVIQGYFGWGQIALSTAGPELTRGLVAAADRLKQLARELAPSLSLAYLGVEPYLGNQLTAFPYLSDDPHVGSLQAVSSLLDELLFGVFPWQIIGPGHVRRLGQIPTGATPLTRNRVEVGIGEIGDWVPTDPMRQTYLALGQRMFEPCLVRGAALAEIARQHWASRNPRSGQ